MTPAARILVVAPHPDDETLGCGGTLARKAAAGCDVFIAVLTDGSGLFTHALKITRDPSPTEVSELRKDETRRAIAILGLRQDRLFFFDFKDGTLDANSDVAADRLARLWREINPGEVYCTSKYEGHKDHVATERIVREARARAGSSANVMHYITTLAYGTSLGDVAEEVVMLDIIDVLPLKRRAVAQFHCHLGIVSPQQRVPLCADFDQYLTNAEPFIMPGRLHSTKNVA